jgi:hypothetical protein
LLTQSSLQQNSSNAVADKEINDQTLYLEYGGKRHTVDSIFSHKVTSAGTSLFLIKMCCTCCFERKYWYTMK